MKDYGLSFTHIKAFRWFNPCRWTGIPDGASSQTGQTFKILTK